MTIAVRNRMDLFGHRELIADVVSEDHSNGWTMNLVTKDIPSGYGLSESDKLRISIIDASDIDVNSKNTIYLPVMLRAVSVMDDHVMFYYGSLPATANGDKSPQFTADGYMRVEQGMATQRIVQPFMRLEFEFETSSSSSDRPGADSLYGGLRMAEPREHVDSGENSMGGLDLPVGDQKSDVAEEERLHQESLHHA
jgi:hypothetical protein